MSNETVKISDSFTGSKLRHLKTTEYNVLHSQRIIKMGGERVTTVLNEILSANADWTSCIKMQQQQQTSFCALCDLS